MKRILMLCACLLAVPAFGQTIYKCPAATPDAPPILQQTPCANGEAISTKPAASGASTTVDHDLLERQQRNAEVMQSMTRQDSLYQEGSLAGWGSSGGSYGAGGGRSYNKPVHVRAYTRKDGTAVRGHYRALPDR